MLQMIQVKNILLNVLNQDMVFILLKQQKHWDMVIEIMNL